MYFHKRSIYISNKAKPEKVKMLSIVSGIVYTVAVCLLTQSLDFVPGRPMLMSGILTALFVECNTHAHAKVLLRTLDYEGYALVL